MRRSSRIQRKSSRLPTMLVDHDPCVSSLAELVKLNDDANAYIYRRNPALLHDLPDQTSLWGAQSANGSQTAHENYMGEGVMDTLYGF